MPIGIEAINLYAGRLRTDAVEISVRRGKDREIMTNQVMIDTRSVFPSFEDAVTLAVNAVYPLLNQINRDDIELLVIGTESPVDDGKPISSWVHRFCGLAANCRSYDVKHACYGGTAALKIAGFWIASGLRPGKKALVISTDLTRPQAGLDFETIGGGCAVAMLVSDHPRVLEFDLTQTGYWTQEVTDVFRPTALMETGDRQVSLMAYLDALDGSFQHYRQQIGDIDLLRDFKKHIYHAPFPGMTFTAHRFLMRSCLQANNMVIQTSFQERVGDSLRFSQRIGTAYGASNFVCLLSLLHYSTDLNGGDNISFFAYGSGCQGEFYRAAVSNDATHLVHSLDIEHQLEARYLIPFEHFERSEQDRRASIGAANYRPFDSAMAVELYDQAYANQNLLVLERIENHYRDYRWS